MKEEPLSLAIEQYCTLKGLAPPSKKLYLRAGAVYGEHLKRDAIISDLDDFIFAQFIESRSQQVARETLRGECAKLLAVWRWCASPKRSWADFPEVQSPEAYYSVPKALDKKQLSTLWRFVESLTGYIGLVPEKIYWLALFYVLWDASERIGAVYQIRREDIDLNRRWLTIYPWVRKGHRKHGRVYRIRRSTARALQKLLDYTNSDQPFAIVSSNLIYKRWRAMRIRAGLPLWATFHSIRRSHASHLTVAGGDARRSLGHSSEAVTDRSYRDPRITNQGRQPCDRLFDPLPWWRRLWRPFG